MAGYVSSASAPAASSAQTDLVNCDIRTVTPDEAAQLLGVNAQTLAMWTERFGYPARAPSRGSGRGYPYTEVVALRDALVSEVSVASAVRKAQRRPRVHAHGEP